VDEIANILESELQAVQPAQLPSRPTVPSIHSDRSGTENTFVTLDLQCRVSPFSEVDTSDVKASSQSDTVSCDLDTKAAPDLARELCQQPSDAVTNSASSVAINLPSSSDATNSEASVAAICRLKSEASTSAASATVTDAVLSETVSCQLSPETVTNCAALSKVVTSSVPSESVTHYAAASEAMQSGAEPSGALTESSAKFVLSRGEETLAAAEHGELCTVSSNLVTTSKVKVELPEPEMPVLTAASCVPCTMFSCVSEHSSDPLELSITGESVSAVEHQDVGGSQTVCESVMLPVMVKSERQSVTDATVKHDCKDVGVVVKREPVELDHVMPSPQNSEFTTQFSVMSASTSLTSDSSVISSLAVTSDPSAVTSDPITVTSDPSAVTSDPITVTSDLSAVTSNTLTHEFTLMKTMTAVASSVTSLSTSVSMSCTLTSTATSLSTTKTHFVTSAPGTICSRVANCVSSIMTFLPNARTSLTTTVSLGQSTITPLSSSAVTTAPYAVTNMPLSSGEITSLTTVSSLSMRDVSDADASVVQMSESLESAARSASRNMLNDHCEKVDNEPSVSLANVAPDSILSLSLHALEVPVLSTSHATNTCVSSGPAAISVNDSFSEDELHIVLPDDSFTASEPAADNRFQVSSPLRHSAAVSIPPDAVTAVQLSADSNAGSPSSDLMPCIAAMFAEMSLFRPLSPIPGCQHCTVCESESTEKQVIMTRKRSITQRKLSEHSDDDNNASIDTSAASDHVRTSTYRTHEYFCVLFVNSLCHCKHHILCVGSLGSICCLLTK